jgi:hypothetical protein
VRAAIIQDELAKPVAAAVISSNLVGDRAIVALADSRREEQTLYFITLRVQDQGIVPSIVRASLSVAAPTNLISLRELANLTTGTPQGFQFDEVFDSSSSFVFRTNPATCAEQLRRYLEEPETRHPAIASVQVERVKLEHPLNKVGDLQPYLQRLKAKFQ